MAVQRWGGPGEWVTDRAGVAYSDDGGQNWVRPPQAIRPNSGGNSNFEMSALLMAGDQIFVYGTPSGRSGAVRLARVNASQHTDLVAYEYFSNGKWVRGDVDAATPIIGTPTGEMSVGLSQQLPREVRLARDDQHDRGAHPAVARGSVEPAPVADHEHRDQQCLRTVHPSVVERQGPLLTTALFQIYNVLLWKVPLDLLR